MKRQVILFLFMAICLGFSQCSKLSVNEESQMKAGDIIPHQQSKEKTPNSDNIEEGYTGEFVSDDSSAPPACNHNGDGNLPYLKPVSDKLAGEERK